MRAAAKPGRTPLASQFLVTAGHIARWREAGLRGHLALVTRMASGGVPPEPFWALMDAIEARDSELPFWQAVLPLMVECEHRAGWSAGRAMRDARVSAGRFERWLRTDRTTAWREARKLLRRLEGIDWGEFGPILRSWTVGARTRLAKQYYSRRPIGQAPLTTRGPST